MHLLLRQSGHYFLCEIILTILELKLGMTQVTIRGVEFAIALTDRLLLEDGGRKGVHQREDRFGFGQAYHPPR